jgi:hypothetical protein
LSAHLPQLHPPRWLRERLHGGASERRRAARRPGRARRVSLLPVALVAALALGAWTAQIADVAASGAPLGVRMVAAGIGLPPGDGMSARLADDAPLTGVLADMPAASVDAITL